MILLSDPLPLRRAADLPVWLDDAPLPWVYGRVTLSPVCISAERTEWLIADHAIAGVSSVAAGGEPVTGWQHINRLDDTGVTAAGQPQGGHSPLGGQQVTGAQSATGARVGARTIAVLRTSQPVKEGVQLAVACTGALDERSGEVIEHPAAIARDLLKRCGRAPAPDAFLGLHDAMPDAACGIVFDGGTLREALSDLFAPFDVLWNAADTRAVPLDVGANNHSPFAITPRTAARAEATCALDDVFTRARVLFDYDYAAKQHRQALTIDAPESRAQHGVREINYEYPHIHAARLALELAQTWLARDAAACWQIDADIDTGAAIQYGDVIDLAHPHLPAGRAIVTSVTQTGQTSSIKALHWQSAQVTLARHSAAATPDSARPAYVYKDGVATFTILDDTGAPIAHATVMLDGITSNRTNARGEVSFKTPRGAHSLTVYADGYEPFTLDVVL